MTKLLVSVRDEAEARTALEVGVDLLDLKEPNRGALGSVAPATVDGVAALVAGSIPLSAAAGELLDLPENSVSLPAISRRLAFIKTGLAGCADDRAWPAKLAAFATALPPTVAPVAVVYADAAAVAAPDGETVLDVAVDLGFHTLLVDTAIKDGRGLLDHWSIARLQRFLSRARKHGFTTVVGGSLNLTTIPEVAACETDYIAVRGAACAGSRTGAIDPARLREVRALVDNCKAHGRPSVGF